MNRKAKMTIDFAETLFLFHAVNAQFLYRLFFKYQKKIYKPMDN